MDTMSVMFGFGMVMAGVMCAVCGFMLGVDRTEKRVMKGDFGRKPGLLG